MIEIPGADEESTVQSPPLSTAPASPSSPAEQPSLSNCAVFLLTLRDPHCIVRDTWKILEKGTEPGWGLHREDRHLIAWCFLMGPLCLLGPSDDLVTAFCQNLRNSSLIIPQLSRRMWKGSIRRELLKQSLTVFRRAFSCFLFNFVLLFEFIIQEVRTLRCMWVWIPSPELSSGRKRFGQGS